MIGRRPKTLAHIIIRNSHLEKNWTMFDFFSWGDIYNNSFLVFEDVDDFLFLGKAYVSKMRPFLYEFANVMLSSVYSQQMRLMSCVLDPSFARM